MAALMRKKHFQKRRSLSFKLEKFSSSTRILQRIHFEAFRRRRMIRRACLKKLDYRGCTVSLMVFPAAECVSYKLVMLSWQYCCNGFSNH
ncbi:hypothetical protein WN943_025949 [Citrus x changshan-huyou]